MLEALISSKTRLKLLMKFFLNSNASAHLRGLEGEFGESSNAIRIELNRFEEAGLLHAQVSGNKKVFRANTQHPLFGEIHNILLKSVGLDQVVEKVIMRLGDLNRVYLTGSFSKGLDSQVIDLIFIGNVEMNYLVQLITKVEELIHRKVRYLVYTEQEFPEIDWQQFQPEPLLLWSKTAA
jgi:DNA-binding transcriptional ArsR family regulator